MEGFKIGGIQMPQMTDYDKAIVDPTLIFDKPQQVLERKDLTDEQKITILRAWKYDEIERSVADDENMTGGKPGYLDEVLTCLRRLGVDETHEPVSPTKHAG